MHYFQLISNHRQATAENLKLKYQIKHLKRAVAEADARAPPRVLL